MKRFNFGQKGISSISLYMIIAFIFIGILFGVFYRQTLTDHLINLLPGVSHTKVDPDLDSYFVDEKISELQFQLEFVKDLKRFHFNDSVEDLDFPRGDCVSSGLKNVLNSQVPFFVLDSDDNILLAVQRPERDFDLNPRTNAVQVKYSPWTEPTFIDFLWDSYSFNSLAGVNIRDSYIDWDSSCKLFANYSEIPSQRERNFLWSRMTNLFDANFYQDFSSNKDGLQDFFCGVLKADSFDKYVSDFSSFFGSDSWVLYLGIVHSNSVFFRLSPLQKNTGFDSFESFLRDKMLKGRPYYEETWIKTGGIFPEKIGNMHCVPTQRYSFDDFDCYPIYVYRSGTDKEKEYYFDYGTRTFKSVSDDSELDILREVGVGGKIIYFAGNQAWWASCKRGDFLEKGFVAKL